MLDQVLSWLVLVVPVGLGLVVILVPSRGEDQRGYRKWLRVLGVFLILYGGLSWWQQSRVAKAAISDRQDAIQKLQNR